jgi:hypothetical protein
VGAFDRFVVGAFFLPSAFMNINSSSRHSVLRTMQRVLSIDCGTRSLGICYVQAPHEILRWCVVDLGSPQVMPATETLAHMIGNRGSLSWMFQTPTEVPLVIEMQPQSGPVKTISHILQALSRFANPQRPVFFMPAVRKFQAFNTTLSPAIKSYAQRKRFAQTLVETHASFVDVYGINRQHVDFYSAHNAKKRGDLADCYLQAVSFVRNPLLNTITPSVGVVNESAGKQGECEVESIQDTLLSVAENWRGC